MTGTPAPDPAKKRFFIIQALRWAGVAFVLAGLLIVNRKIALPQIVGYLFVVNGLVDAFVLPVILARRWKTPKP